MEMSSLCLLLLLNSLHAGSPKVSVTLSPNRSQFFKRESFSVSCEEDEEEPGTTWTVMKRTDDGEVSQCASSCSISAAYPATDSGEYWCGNQHGATSNSFNITVTAGPVVLEIPGLPVTEGDDVVLRCRLQSHTSGWAIYTAFYRDGNIFGGSYTGNITLFKVSTSDEGQYKCGIFGSDKSPESKLTVRGRGSAAHLLSVFTLLRHLLVGSPFLLSTILLGLICRDRRKVQQAKRSRQTSTAVIMEMEHCRVYPYT
ncbi:Fc receptor-like B isoform X2 [Cheilinus undulatus]|uniref:Fc receptor-like B isoform X2 n=1 Tax=Cheilinus undulatus TaxID=241271 RepID=UPI001BD3295F|nr:Fc receptor-like B isoform X2 [Cheilinus undulatus]